MSEPDESNDDPRSDLDRAFFWALGELYKGDDKPRELLAAGADPHTVDYHGYTALFRAAESHRLELVRDLLAAGADANGTDRYGTPALLSVVDYADLEKHPQIPELIDVLLSGGADIDRPGPHRKHTPLMRAVCQQRESLVLQLVEAGASLEATDSEGRTALDLARQCGHVELFGLLGSDPAEFEGPDPEIMRLEAAILEALRAGGRYSDTYGGYKYEYDNTWQAFWDDGVWVLADYDDYTRRLTVRRDFVPDDAALLDVLHGRNSSGRTPRRDGLARALTAIAPRGPTDLVPVP